MDVYTSESQQIEQIKQWFKENGAAILLGLALGISAIFGWRYWQTSNVDHAEAASALYSDMIDSLRDEDQTAARASAERILAEYENTAYAVFTLLALARLAVEDNDLDTAGTRLRQALEKNRDPSFAHVIRLRLGRVLIGGNKLAEANSLLEREETGEFAASYAELLGDINVLQGDIEAARNAYQESIDKARANGLDVSGLELKIDNLGQPRSAS